MFSIAETNAANHLFFAYYSLLVDVSRPSSEKSRTSSITKYILIIRSKIGTRIGFLLYYFKYAENRTRTISSLKIEAIERATHWRDVRHENNSQWKDIMAKLSYIQMSHSRH